MNSVADSSALHYLVQIKADGESTSLALSLETHADTLLIDERAATGVAKRRGILRASV